VVAQEAEVVHAAIWRNHRIAADAFSIDDKKFVKLFRLNKPLVRNLRNLTSKIYVGH